MIRHPPRSPLFPYTTLSRSAPAARAAAMAATLVPARRRAVFDRLAPVGRGRCMAGLAWMGGAAGHGAPCRAARSEEHTSELQSPCNLVCRLLLEKKKKKPQEVIHSVHVGQPSLAYIVRLTRPNHQQTSIFSEPGIYVVHSKSTDRRCFVPCCVSR